MDFGSNTIRIDFLQQPATYGMGSYFTFSSLDPQLPGCPPASISGISVTTNKPAAQFNVVAAATFGPHTVTVQIAPGNKNLDWQPGEFVLVKLSFACETKLAPVINENTSTVIPGQYMVIFRPGTPRSDVLVAERTVASLGGKIGFRYTSALLGFSATLPANALQAVRGVNGVAYVEADQKVSLNTLQTSPPTGLDRTSERLLGVFPAPPLDSRYTYSETGAGVHAYVIDTGILTSHNEFGGRASGTFFDAFGGNGQDCHGHGTHVAGTIGGSTYGIAKDVLLHRVRVLDCYGNGSESGVAAGVDWVTSNRPAGQPAVANMSLGGQPGISLPTANTAVTNSIASGVTYVIAAGNSNADACTVSPALVPTAITVGAIDPTNDTRASFSNWGQCLDVFAPGVGILSASKANNTATNTLSGTSMAAPHMAGVAALYLQTQPLASPANVWSYVHTFSNDLTTTPGWAGIINPGPGSPNELLHWGSLDDGVNDGDPHITTVSAVRYDFQSAGEFVTLRDAALEIQTRQTPVAAWGSCVSLNTAIAARVNNHRVTFQPNLNGVPDPNGLQLRVDGVLVTPSASGFNLGNDGRVVSSAGGGIEIDFPDGTVLIVTPGWWASQSKWYLTVSVLHTRAEAGIMGALAAGNWLPALPNGTSLGAMPSSLHQRFVDLNQTFADAWRVTNATSLFDYALGTSTATFTMRSWPQESGACVLPQQPPVKPIEPGIAQQLCSAISDKNTKANCVFDVAVTGEAGFAKTYTLAQQIRRGSTRITVINDKDFSQAGEAVTFMANVAQNALGERGTPTGTVQFMLDGEKAGIPVRLDSNGRATWKTQSLRDGKHQIQARYLPNNDSMFLASSSLDKAHTVGLWEIEVGPPKR
jgi:subtilisin family serine protease